MSRCWRATRIPHTRDARGSRPADPRASGLSGAGRATGRVYPIEVKPTRDAVVLYESDALQLAAYMVLLEFRYGPEFAGYGVVRYRATEFRVPFTAELRRRCITAAEAIAKRGGPR